jgi:hypothetical protein
MRGVFGAAVQEVTGAAGRGFLCPARPPLGRIVARHFYGVAKGGCVENVFCALSEEGKQAVNAIVDSIDRKDIREKALREGNEKRFDYKGYPCAIVRRGVYLCGYVGLFDSHKYYGKQCEDIYAYAHGGLTYSEMDSGLWVIGFDCAHAGDYTGYLSDDDDIYRDMEYVEKQIMLLVDQIA